MTEKKQDNAPLLEPLYYHGDKYVLQFDEKGMPGLLKAENPFAENERLEPVPRGLALRILTLVSKGVRL